MRIFICFLFSFFRVCFGYILHGLKCKVFHLPFYRGIRLMDALGNKWCPACAPYMRDIVIKHGGI